MTEDLGPNRTETSEIQIASLTVLADNRFLDAVTDMVADIAKVIGLDDESAQKLNAILEEVLKKIFEYGYERDTTQSVQVLVSKRAYSLIVAVKDKGLPFDYQVLEQGADPRFSAFLSRGYADNVNFINLGPAGNQIELVKGLPSTDIRDQLNLLDHHKALEAKEANIDENLTTRIMQPEEAVDLARLVFRCYGYTYPNEFIYYPDQVEARQRAGLMRSFVMYNSQREMVGHVALSFDRSGAKVAESGQALVDPRYRGHKIFEHIKRFILDYASANQIIGIYGEAVTVHPYSQKGSLALGAHEVGFLLGYSPGTISFLSINNQERPRRQSIALMYTSILNNASVCINPPDVYHTILKRIYEVIGIKPEIIKSISPLIHEKPEQTGHVNVSIRPDHNQALLNVEVVGINTLDEIRFHLKQLCLNHIECIYVDLPLFSKQSGVLGAQLRKMGFFFGGVIPGLRDGDILRMQYLNNIEISRDDIAIASDFGRTLLDFIFEDRTSVVG